MRARAAPGAIAASRSIAASSGSISTTTSSTPSVAAASLSATTSATGWPEYTISSRASGWPARPAAPVDERQVGRGEHRDHPVDAQRRLAVDARDPPVCLGGEHQARVQQALDRDVGRVARGPADLALTVDPARVELLSQCSWSTMRTS